MINDKDTQFLERLQSHPNLRSRFESILDVAESEGNNPDTADAVEQKVVEEVRKLGAEVMGDWAVQKAAKETEILRKANPHAQTYKKKE